MTEITSIGQRIREMRTKRGLSQYDLATAVGVRAQMVYRYEKALSRPSSDVLDKLAKALEVTPGWLLRGNEAALIVVGESHPVFEEFSKTGLALAAPRDLLDRLSRVIWNDFDVTVQDLVNLVASRLTGPSGAHAEPRRVAKPHVSRG